MAEKFLENNNYNPKLIYIAAALGSLIPLYVIFVDLPLIENMKWLYVLGRGLTSLVCTFVLIQVAVFKKQYSWQVPLIFLILCLYGIHGQWFLPCYYLAYMEVIVCFSLFFPLQKSVFYGIFFPTLIGMFYSIIASPATYSTVPLIDQKFRFDAIMGVLIIGVISGGCYHFVTRVRHLKELIFSKFSDIGKNATSIMHDFKGFIQPPLFLVHQLKSEITDPKALEIIDSLEQELLFIKNYLKEFNHIYTSQEISIQKVKLDDLKNSIEILLKNHLNGVDLSFEKSGSDYILFDQNVIIKILYNTIMNSIEANKNASGLKVVVVAESDKELTITDNGKGIDKSQLKDLNADGFIKTSKSTGSGVGMFLAKDILKTHGAKLVFSNCEKLKGAKITLKLA